MKTTATILVLIFGLFLGTTINGQVQMEGGLTNVQSVSVSNCALDIVEAFRACLNVQGLDVLTNFGSGNMLFVSVFGAKNHGQVQQCVAKYNSDKKKCASAPTLVVESK